MFLMPVGEHLVGCLPQFGIRIGKRGIDHRQFMRVGADRLDVAAHGDAAVGGADEGIPQPLDHRLHAPILPEEGMPPTGAEIGDLQPVDPAQPLDLFPDPGHRAGIEDLKLELAHRGEDGARAQFHQDGERGDFPQHDLGPLALEGQFILVALAFKFIGRQAQVLEPLHEGVAEHLPLAIEGVAAQPCAFAPRQATRAGMVKLFAQLALVDQARQRDAFRPVDKREDDIGVGAVAMHRLAHQKLVEIGVDQRADDGVDLEVVVIDAGGDVGHVRPPAGRRRRACRPAPCRAIRQDRWRGRHPPER